MLTASILIILSTLAGLLTLWRDEIVATKYIPELNETDDEIKERLEKYIRDQKTKKVKLVSSFFIILTLLFTLYQIKLTQDANDKAKYEIKEQRKEDSLTHIAERDEDNRSKQVIDSIYREQVDDKINMMFSFGFWSPKTDAKIKKYIEVNHINNTYVNIDENFPYYRELREILRNVRVEVSLFDGKSRLQMINNVNNKTDFDYIGTPSILYLKNRDKLTFSPYRRATGPDPTMIYFFEDRDSDFSMNYHVPSKSFFFGCRKVPLKLVGEKDQILLLSKYNNYIVRLELITPEVQKNRNIFFNLNSSYINYQLNFSDRKQSEHFSFIKAHNFYEDNIWPDYLIKNVKIESY